MASVVALVLWAAMRARGGGVAVMRRPFFLWVVLFSVVAMFSAAHGWRPQVSIPKLHRLAWFLLIFAVPDAARMAPGGPRVLLRGMIAALALGGTVAAGWHVVRLAWAMTHVPDGVSPAFWFAHQGSMRVPQFHLAVTLFLLPGVGQGFAWPPRARWWALAANVAGLLLHLKRGVWMAFAAAWGVLVLSGCRVRPMAVAVGLAIVAAFVAVPAVRARILAAPSDFLQRGGRWELWTQCAPRLIAKAPWGIGYGGMRNFELRHIARTIEPKLTHLHNNALQVLVEMGWLGLAVWIGWMAHALLAMAANVRRLCRTGDGWSAALARGVFATTCGLLLNGLGEYNFGTGTVLILFALLMGMTDALQSVELAESLPEEIPA